MTNDTDDEVVSPQEEIIWLAVFVTECILILIINAFTLIIFARNRRLRKCSTYLIINLTVADLLLGTVTALLGIFASDNLERNLKSGEGFRWQAFFIVVFNNLFVVASLANISLISLERLHATIYSFRHCLIGEWVYFKIIICSWFISLLLTFLLAFLCLCVPIASTYAFASCMFFTLLILTISYVMIISNVKSNPHSQKFGLKLSAERKLSITLFIVTVISYLTILPQAVGYAIPHDTRRKVSPAITLRFFATTSVLYLANSLANPLIYAIRMEEFRKAAKELFYKKEPESMHVQPIKLPTM